MDYLKAYRTAQIPTAAVKPEVLRNDFMPYLIASCWRKMRHRVTHWSAEGVLHGLAYFTGPEFRLSFDTYHRDFRNASVVDRSQQRRDSVLAEQFLKFKEGLGSQPLTAPFFTDTDNGSLPSFVRAMEALKDGKASVLDVFNSDAAYEFNILLVSTIFRYREFLNQLNTLSSDWPLEGLECHDRRKKRSAVAREVLRFGTLLWFIAYSEFLRLNLLLLKGASLHKPTESSQRQKVYHGTFSCLRAMKDEDEDEDEDDGEGEGEGEGHTEERYLEYIRSMVSHLEHFQVLSTWSSKSTSTPPKITLIKAKRPHNDIEYESLYKTLSDVSDDPKGDLKLIKRKCEPLHMARETSVDMLHQRIANYEDSTKKLPPYKGNLHCEVALASLPLKIIFDKVQSGVNSATIEEVIAEVSTLEGREVCYTSIANVLGISSIISRMLVPYPRLLWSRSDAVQRVGILCCVYVNSIMHQTLNPASMYWADTAICTWSTFHSGFQSPP